MKIWKPKKPPCNPQKKHLQTLSDARAWRNRFKLNHLAKLASGLFVPQLLKMSPGYPCCCGGADGFPCGTCILGTVKDEVDVIFDGVVNDRCGECDTEFNGSFITSQLIDLSGLCKWFLSTGSLCGEGRSEITVFVTSAFISVSLNVFQINEVILNSFVTWALSISEKPDCDFNNLSLPFLSQGFSSGPLCDWSGSTATLNAL